MVLHVNTDELSSVLCDLRERKFYGLTRENIFVIPEPPMPAFRFDPEDKVRAECVSSASRSLSRRGLWQGLGGRPDGRFSLVPALPAALRTPSLLCPQVLVPDERSQPQNYGTGYRMRQLVWNRTAVQVRAIE